MLLFSKENDFHSILLNAFKYLKNVGYMDEINSWWNDSELQVTVYSSFPKIDYYFTVLSGVSILLRFHGGQISGPLVWFVLLESN